MAVMSAFSKKVTCGICAQERLRCCAVVRRTRLIDSRSTGPNLLKSGSVGVGGVAAGGGATVGGATAAAPARACRLTSSIEMRPPGPLPRTAEISTLTSRANWRTEGAAATLGRPSGGGADGGGGDGGGAAGAGGAESVGMSATGGDGAGADGAAAGGAAAGGAAGADLAGTAPAAAAGSMVTISWPTLIVSP